MSMPARARLACMVAASVLCLPISTQAGPLHELIADMATQLASKVGQTTRAAAARLLGLDDAAEAAALNLRADAALATEQLRQALASANQAAAKPDFQGVLQATAGRLNERGPVAYGTSAARLSLLRTVQAGLSGPPRVVFAGSHAKAFGLDFLSGARQSGILLQQLRTRHPALVDDWLATPPARRVFLVGASQDSQDIVALRQQLDRAGFKTYFFTDCNRHLGSLCTSEEVGAFFGSAGHAIAMQSPAAQASGFIPVELASADVAAGGGLLLVYTPDDVLRSITHMSANDLAQDMRTDRTGHARRLPAVPVELFDLAAVALN